MHRPPVTLQISSEPFVPHSTPRRRRRTFTSVDTHVHIRAAAAVQIGYHSISVGPFVFYPFAPRVLIVYSTMTTETAKLDRTDPRVQKLVYNMYRNVLSTYNDKANTILDALPENQVIQDQGIDRQLFAIL